MSEFIIVEINSSSCEGIEECGQCLKVCPVNIFREGENGPSVIKENQDECTLCDLCIEACAPDAIKIRKLYEEQIVAE